MIVKYAKQIADSEAFHTLILGLILLNAIVMGLETSPILNEYYDFYFLNIILISQAIFAFEITVRLIAYWPKLSDFFDDFWNVFDFIIVLLSFIPLVGPFAIIARLARVFRIARVASVSDQLRNFLHEMHVSLGIFWRAAWVVIVCFYIFAVSGFYLFSEAAPQHWGSLGLCFKSLFLLGLLQNVEVYLNAVKGAIPAGWLYFVIFYGILLVFLINILAAVTAIHLNKEKGDQADNAND